MEALKYCKLETFKKDQIIFYTQTSHENVYLIVKGSVTVKDHSLNIEVPRTAIQLQPGDVINPGDLDGGLLKSFHFWFRCNSDLEVVSMSRKSFENFWFAQTSFGLDTKAMIFKQMRLFKRVSDMTVYKVIYDLMELLTFTNPTIIYNDLSYFEEYKQRKTEAIEGKLASAAGQTAGEYFMRKSNPLNQLTETHNQVRELIKDRSKPRQRGMFIVLEGDCAIYTETGKKIFDLPIGSCFGENLLIRVAKTYNSLGVIATGQKKTQLAFIAKELFFRIPNYDIYQMHLNSQDVQHLNDINVDPF